MHCAANGYLVVYGSLCKSTTLRITSFSKSDAMGIQKLGENKFKRRTGSTQEQVNLSRYSNILPSQSHLIMSLDSFLTYSLRLELGEEIREVIGVGKAVLSAGVVLRLVVDVVPDDAVTHA